MRLLRERLGRWLEVKSVMTLLFSNTAAADLKATMHSKQRFYSSSTKRQICASKQNLEVLYVCICL